MDKIGRVRENENYECRSSTKIRSQEYFPLYISQMFIMVSLTLPCGLTGPVSEQL